MSSLSNNVPTIRRRALADERHLRAGGGGNASGGTAATLLTEGSRWTWRSWECTLALLAYLAVEGGLHPREEVVALLWPEAGEQDGRASLRASLTVLRKVLGHPQETPHALRTVGNAIGLEPSAVMVDAQALAIAAALARHREAPPGLRVQLERAVAAARGPAGQRAW